MNRESLFYRHWEGPLEKRTAVFQHLCGAKIDLAKGALVVDLPSKSEFDSKSQLGEGILHPSDIWLFSGSIRENAIKRTRTWNAKY